jgi:hypothetical protein
MSEILTEKWLTIVLGGGFVFAVLLTIGLRRGQARILMAAGVVFAITCVLLLVERLIVTPREHVRHSLNEIESAVNRKDLETLLTYIHSSQDAIRDRARYYYNSYDIQEANITSIRTFRSLGNDEAQIVFTIVLTGGSSSGAGTYPVAVQANFKKEGDLWKVIKYRWAPVDRAFTNKGFGDEVDFPVDDY